jgi:hypothetical protein
MKRKARNPVAATTACRVPDIDGFGTPIDTGENIPFSSRCLAVQLLVRRFQLTEQSARVVAELSGLGGAR